MSYAAEVIADNSGKWTRNQMRFATKDEAEAYVADLANRWTSVRETRVVESTDPVNSRIADDKRKTTYPWAPVPRLGKE